VLNLADIISNDFKISRFEHLNAVSINIYGIENGLILPLQLISDKKKKNTYLQDLCNDGVGHFAWIKNLFQSRELATQKTKE